MRKIMMMTALMLATFAVGGEAMAQWNQNDACPGWNNPSNFSAQFLNDTGGYTNCWSGQNGYARGSGCDPGNPYTSPNVLTSTTGITLVSTMYSGSSLSNVTAACTNGMYGSSSLPNGNKQFNIMTPTSQATGAPVNRDPNTNNNLKFVPDQFNTNDTTGQIVNTNITRTIRVGDGLGAGNAAALYYELYPTTENAILVLYYAIVVEAPGHGVSEDPAMIIRVMERNAANTGWVQKSDTLAYYITSTPASDGGSVTIGQGGWASTGSGYYSGGFYYKQWSKVVMNLSDCLYQRTRIEIMVRDCVYTAHTAYAYIAGECRPMDITSSGCPAGMSTAVTKLSAPRGMLNYEWGASNFGVAQPVTTLNPGGSNSYFSFRQVASGTEAQGHADYDVQASDFRVMRRPSQTGDTVALADSVGNLQTFRCMMTSAIDPSKPFKTPLYVNVQNTKPLMAVDTMVSCDGSISIKNISEVPGDPTLVVDSTTTYSFYYNTIGDGEPYAVLTGDSATHFFGSHTDIHSYIVRTNTKDPTCYSEALYLTKPLSRPNAGFTASKHVLCDADETVLTDTTAGVTQRWWTFLDENATSASPDAERDTVYGEGTQNRQVSRGFTHGAEPIELIVRNGLYYIDSLVEGDTVWCEDRAYDTVSVFLHPELEVLGDTIVCEGSQTDATVRALGVDGCTYEWSLTYGSVTGGIPAGDNLKVVPYADKSTYYVRVTSPQGCVAWDSIHAYLVKPRLTISPEDGRICPGQTATLTGLAADHYTWTASPADPGLAGQDSNAVINVSPTRTTVYTMIGHGSNDCDALPLKKTVTILPPPIPKVNASPNYVDSDDPTVTLTDASTYGVASHWLFSNGEESVARSVQHTFDEAVGNDSVYGDLTSYNELGCGTQYRFAIPVKLFTAWFPNAFTPGSEDENARFRLYSVNTYEYFHIYIYNRQGMIIYSSDDPAFEWDGTKDGEPCDQGAYVYVCNYRKPGTQTLKSITGTITLIR